MPCLLISQWPAIPFRDEIFIPPKSPFTYLSFSLWYRLNTHYPHTHPTPLSISCHNIASPCLLIYCQPSGNFHNDKFSSPLLFISYTLRCLVWSSFPNPIYLLWSDPIRNNVLVFLLSIHSDILQLYLPWSLQPNSILLLALPYSSLSTPILGNSSFA